MEELETLLNYESPAQTDTELLQLLFDKMGVEEGLKHVRGMFAFIYHEKCSNIHHIARDFVGIKPLYYFCSDEINIFSSEVNPIIFLLKKINKNISFDIENIKKQILFTSALLPQNITLFKNIYSLEPGKVLVLNSKNYLRKSYFYDFKAEESNVDRNSYEDKVDELDAILHDVVFDHLNSQAPLSLTLSGGLDSSLLSVIANKFLEVPTYTVNYNYRGTELKLEDLLYAKMVAINSGIKLNEIHIDFSDFNFSDLCRIAELHSLSDDIRFISMDKMYQSLKKFGFKVVLVGQGADELFGGYLNKHRFNQITDTSENISVITQLLLQRKVSVLPCKQEEIKLLNHLTNSLLSIVDKKEHYSTYKTLLMRTQLQRILSFEDHLGMLHSIETRVPYLDSKICLFSNKLHLNDVYCDKHQSVKKILKSISSRYLPSKIIDRNKSPYPLVPTIALSQSLEKLFKENSLAICSSALVTEIFNGMSSVKWSSYDDRTKWNILMLTATENKYINI